MKLERSALERLDRVAHGQMHKSEGESSHRKRKSRGSRLRDGRDRKKIEKRFFTVAHLASLSRLGFKLLDSYLLRGLAW